MCQADAAIPTQYTNAALQGHSLPPAGLALSCRPLLLGETHFLLAHRCLCSAGSALLQGSSTDHAPHSELPSFLVPLEAWPFLVHLHQGSIQKGPDVWEFFLVKRKSSPGVAGLFSYQVAISVAGRDIHSSLHVTGSLNSWEGRAQLELHAPQCYRPLKLHFLVLQLLKGSERPKFKAGLCSSE